MTDLRTRVLPHVAQGSNVHLGAWKQSGVDVSIANWAPASSYLASMLRRFAVRRVARKRSGPRIDVFIYPYPDQQLMHAASGADRAAKAQADAFEASFAAHEAAAVYRRLSIRIRR